jgi:hypothetical protein
MEYTVQTRLIYLTVPVGTEYYFVTGFVVVLSQAHAFVEEIGKGQQK